MGLMDIPSQWSRKKGFPVLKRIVFTRIYIKERVEVKEHGPWWGTNEMVNVLIKKFRL